MKQQTIDIGDNIKKFRELKDMTRETMAAELEMSLSGYSRIERNEIDLTISRIQKIAQILEVDIAQILNFDATQIFNISNNQMVQGFGSNVSNNNNNYQDPYKDKYIALLENEIQRLKEHLKK